MFVLLAVFAALLVVTIMTGGKETSGEYTSIAYATIFSLLPPVIAIGLALFTKEVYTSLLAGILAGALLYSNGNLETMINTMFFHEEGGMVYKLADAWNVGIIVFLVMLGILVSLSPVTKFQKKQKAFLLGILFFLQKSLAFSNKRRNFAPENKTTSLWYT